MTTVFTKTIIAIVLAVVLTISTIWFFYPMYKNWRKETLIEQLSELNVLVRRLPGTGQYWIRFYHGPFNDAVTDKAYDYLIRLDNMSKGISRIY